MFNRVAILFPLILAGIMALITFWINQTVEQQALKMDGNNRHDPDYKMENFVTKQTNVNGDLSYILTATKMIHYPDDDSTVLKKPKFTQYTADKPYTEIKGAHANVSSDGEEVEILDNVVVIREAFEDKGEMQVLTDKLTLFPNQGLAKTARPVIIKQVPKTIIHATGMIYDKNKKILKLLHKINAHYESPNK